MNILANILGKLNTAAYLIITAIIAIFGVSFLVSLIVRSRYINMQRELDNLKNRNNGVFNSGVLNRIVDDYKLAASENYPEVNTQAIIEKNFNKELRMLNLGERFVKNSVSLIIILGLLGTFYGLTMSVEKLVELLSSTGNTEMLDSIDSIVGGLILSVRGMSVAFVTSLIGIAFSVILTIINIIVNIEESRESLMVSIEEYLDNIIAPGFSKNREEKYSALNKTLVSAFENIGEKIESDIRNAFENLGGRLIKGVVDIELAVKSLGETVERFDESLKTFRENTRDFSEFNFNLRHNIERMDVSFVDLTEALKETSKIIVNNYKAIEGLSKVPKNGIDSDNKNY